MIRGRINWLFCVIFLMCSLFFNIGINVYAEESSSVSVDAVMEIPSTSQGIVVNICTQGNSSVNLSGNKIVLSTSTSGNSMLLKFKTTNYASLEIRDKNTFMEASLKAVTKSGLPAKTKNSIYNFIASQDSSVSNALNYLKTDANADFVEAKKLFDPWSGVVGTILGVLCLLIFMFTSLSILFDVFYIALPGVQVIFDRGDSNKKPILISKEAYHSVQDAEKDSEYRNVLAMYLRRRVGLLIIMAICIGYLISGQIYDIVAYIIDAFTL